jgi:AhpD family alkylhydroperoxidase
MANSPAVLESFLALTGAMGGTSIGDRLHHQIKLAASEANGCSYCTSLLCATGLGAGLTAADLVEGRSGAAADPRTDAALKFAGAVLETRGKVSDGDLGAVRKAGLGDAERAILFAIEAWDVNCHQHIHERFSRRQIAPVIAGLEARIAELEKQLEAVRGRVVPPERAASPPPGHRESPPWRILQRRFDAGADP